MDGWMDRWTSERMGGPVQGMSCTAKGRQVVWFVVSVVTFYFTCMRSECTLVYIFINMYNVLLYKVNQTWLSGVLLRFACLCALLFQLLITYENKTDSPINVKQNQTEPIHIRNPKTPTNNKLTNKTTWNSPYLGAVAYTPHIISHKEKEKLYQPLVNNFLFTSTSKQPSHVPIDVQYFQMRASNEIYTIYKSSHRKMPCKCWTMCMYLYIV